MRCARCGNENPETNRFCGMCGASLLPAAVAAAPTQSPAARSSPTPPPPAPLRPENAPAPRISAPISGDSPVISGPSFLGLNQPAPRKRASLSQDPHASPGSSNLDYLLEDEGEPKRGGGGRFVFILLALALAVGLGYLRWKNQGFGWISSSANKPSPASQTSDGDRHKFHPGTGAEWSQSACDTIRAAHHRRGAFYYQPGDGSCPRSQSRRDYTRSRERHTCQQRRSGRHWRRATRPCRQRTGAGRRGHSTADQP